MDATQREKWSGEVLLLPESKPSFLIDGEAVQGNTHWDDGIRIKYYEMGDVNSGPQCHALGSICIN